ncbi:MAG: pectin acetylesterase-family hydrolase, partial [Polyangiaceae bacterium]
ADRAVLEEAAVTDIEGDCSDLADLIAVDASMFVERAARQVDCLAAAAHPDPGGVSLRCGPSYAQFDAPRGQWTRVDVDGGRWGTLCGDGSPYAFHVRLAPDGQPLDRVVIGLQGGGVCLFADDCEARFASSPGLFTADDDEPPFSGIMDDDPANNPFADWTRVFLPYCTQDVFAGGGTEETLGNVTVARYGSVNMRAAVQMVRDVLWREMDAEGGDGFRPDEVVALFGGWSAGGYGTIYNYHWLLDDLLWPRTSAYPDAGLGLDNGSALGVKGLGAVKIPAWGMRPNLPPYCFVGDCAAGDVLFDALSPRLLRVPEQQLLAVSNPLDSTQAGDAFFEDDVSFINALRATYCNTKDLPGIQWYLTSTSTESVHVVTLRPEHWEGAVDGVVMKDWFERAVSDPASLQDRAEEADFTAAVPGVMPFPCEVAP